MRNDDVIPGLRRYGHEAMATVFEIRIAGEDADYARRCATEAFVLIDRLESRLSRFRESSDVSRLAALGPGEAMRVNPDTFACLRLSLEIAGATGGAFDPGLGDITSGRTRENGRGRLVLFPDDCAVLCEGASVSPDLGAIGKGFALDAVAALLTEWEIGRALLVAGGGSSILALDGPAPDRGWEVTLSARESIFISNSAVGSSGVAVKGAHIIDPRDGSPRNRYARTWATARGAGEADALSTAWMLLEPAGIRTVCEARQGAGAAVLETDDGGRRVLTIGDFPTTIPL